MMVQKWISELKEKTGRSLDEWIASAKKQVPANEKDRRERLKISHKLGTNSTRTRCGARPAPSWVRGGLQRAWKERNRKKTRRKNIWQRQNTSMNSIPGRGIAPPTL